MAIKGDRQVIADENTFWMNTVAEAGGCVVVTTGQSGSGSALDQSVSRVEYAASASGKIPVGLLMHDTVNIDTTKYHVDDAAGQKQIPTPVCLLRKGWLVTNMLETGAVPTLGDTAYVGYSGLLHDGAESGSAARSVAIGRFEGIKDSSGYARVYVNL